MTYLAARSIAVTGVPKHQLDVVVAGVVVAGQRQPTAVPVLGVAGQPDAVVGGVGLLGEHGDPPGAVGVAGPQRLDEPVPDHAVADDDDTLFVARMRRG